MTAKKKPVKTKKRKPKIKTVHELLVEALQERVFRICLYSPPTWVKFLPSGRKVKVQEVLGGYLVTAYDPLTINQEVGLFSGMISCGGIRFEFPPEEHVIAILAMVDQMIRLADTR